MFEFSNQLVDAHNNMKFPAILSMFINFAETLAVKKLIGFV